MATAIVARALAEAHVQALPGILTTLAVLLHALLLTAFLIKATCRRQALKTELRDPSRVFGHYTQVAASGVLAVSLAADRPQRMAAYALTITAALTWTALAVPTLTALRGDAPRTVLRQADGTWFLATVGLQSIVTALTSVAPTSPALLASASVLWAAGLLAYALTLSAVIWRLRHHPPGPDQLTPAYWITMGAAAISTLAGARLAVCERRLPRG
ncbi:SLAC1 family transporter, partial [Streptomyces olivaceoviridis]